jgi:hypothetical protein
MPATLDLLLQERSARGTVFGALVRETDGAAAGELGGWDKGFGHWLPHFALGGLNGRGPMAFNPHPSSCVARGIDTGSELFFPASHP